MFSIFLVDLCAHLVDLTFEVQHHTMLDPMIIGIACRVHSLHALQYRIVHTTIGKWFAEREHSEVNA